MVIAIDGPAGTGKTTIAKRLASEFNILYLNTGNMYRAVALYFSRKYGEFTEEIVNLEIDKISIDVKYHNGSQLTLLNGEVVDEYLRTENISMLASKVSAFKKVRDKLVHEQRLVAKKQSLVMDGRDIASVVLPDADVKIFLTASCEVRAKRRALELESKGLKVDYNKLVKDIKERDYNDSHRKNSPLVKVEDAVEIDTSNLTIDEVVEKCLNLVKCKAHH